MTHSERHEATPRLVLSNLATGCKPGPELQLLDEVLAVACWHRWRLGGPLQTSSDGCVAPGGAVSRDAALQTEGRAYRK